MPNVRFLLGHVHRQFNELPYRGHRPWLAGKRHDSGGVIGSQIGSGSGRTAAIVGGTILGAVVGGSIGNTMDNLDHNCVGQALEHAPDGQQIVWNSPTDNAEYRVTPTNSYQSTDGRYCREYRTNATIGGKPQEVYGTSCRQPDGSWELVS